MPAPQPLRGLEPLAGGRWLATDADPQFLVELDGTRPAGTYLVVAVLDTDEETTPRVYFDCGSGWSEDTCAPLAPGPSRSDWRALVRAPGFGPRLRFDPSDRPGLLTLRSVDVWPVSDGDAQQLIAARTHAASGSLEANGVRAGAGIAGLLRITDLGRRATTDDRYNDWALAHDTLDGAALDVLRAAAQRFDARPPLSVVVVAGAASMVTLAACVDSVREQVYPDWELLVVVGANTAPDTRQRLRAVVATDRRIRVLAGGATGWPGLLAQATGQYVAVIEPTLHFAPHALLAIAAAIGQFPAGRVFYADVDSADETGRRDAARFRPAFDRDLLEHDDYLHPCAFHALDCARSAAGRAGDAMLDTLLATLARQCAHSCAVDCVVHVPHILAHVSGSAVVAGPATEDHADSRRYARTAAMRPDGTGTSSANGEHGVPTPVDQLVGVSIVIPTRDGVDLLRRCIDSVLANDLPEMLEIIVVDNQSSEPAALAYLSEIARDARIHVLRHDAPFNYSAINNAAVAEATGDLVVLLNNDIEVISRDWIARMRHYAERPDVGAVGAMLYFPDDTIQHAGVIVGLGGVAGHRFLHAPRGSGGHDGRALHVQALGAVTAACLMVRRQLYLDVGGLDESLQVAFNDVDFCLRLAARGLRNIWTPHAELYHHESASRGVEDTPEKQTRFAGEVAAMRARWGSALEQDPAYHPLLSLVPTAQFQCGDRTQAGLRAWMSVITAERRGAVVGRTPCVPAPAGSGTHLVAGAPDRVAGRIAGPGRGSQ